MTAHRSTRPLSAADRAPELDIRHATHPDEFTRLDTDGLRRRFLVQDLFAVPDRVRWVLSHHDRLLVGGADLSGAGPLPLAGPEQLRGDHLLERRELAIVGLSGRAGVRAGSFEYVLERHDVLYVGQGQCDVELAGQGRVYLVLAPAHHSFPTTLTRSDDVEKLHLGEQAQANVRTISKHVHTGGTASAQLVLGITELSEGSVWNTMPAHVHDRRTEVYLYTDLGNGRVIHLCGTPDATRSIVVADGQAVISPPWSVHCGAGTSSYSFVWAMAGENVDYTDVEPVGMEDLR